MKPIRSIDLNCDLGEGAGHDAELMPLITSANIACGAHAGDVATMRATVALAQQPGVAIGAHPGFADRANFGRIEQTISPAAAAELVAAQVAQFSEIAGAGLRHVKLHGALYNQVSRDAALAAAVTEKLHRSWPQLILFALAGSELLRAAQARKLRVVSEVFADRTYQRDGTLTPRSRADALIQDEGAAVAQVLRMVREGLVRATDGTDVPIAADTVCLHGDGPHPVEFARRLRAELLAAGIGVRACAGGSGEAWRFVT
jgi:UPF0271 protein